MLAADLGVGLVYEPPKGRSRDRLSRYHQGALYSASSRLLLLTVSLQGHTELTIVPFDAGLRTVYLHCRQSSQSHTRFGLFGITWLMCSSACFRDPLCLTGRDPAQLLALGPTRTLDFKSHLRRH
jgi:hypothetical protein